jgi:hypothetical protein
MTSLQICMTQVSTESFSDRSSVEWKNRIGFMSNLLYGITPHDCLLFSELYELNRDSLLTSISPFIVEFSDIVFYL